MINDQKQKILIIDDEIDNIKILIELFKSDYKTFFADTGKKGLKIAQSNTPDLILLDIIMPEMDGYDVCLKLKDDLATAEIPVIFISAMTEVGDETKGLELGAVDYIAKPFSPPIVHARVKNHLKLRESMLNLQSVMDELKLLYSMALDANPITKLPGNNSVAARIEGALNQEEKVCVIYADLDNFKAFNDKYGFAMGDEVIQYTCRIFKNALADANIADGFIGHIGGDDFVVIVPFSHAQTLADMITQQFDDGIIRFYTPEDIAAKCIKSINRQGGKETFPIISISLAGVDLSHGNFKQYIEVNDACAETKKKAKAISGSIFFLDRRNPNDSAGQMN